MIKGLIIANLICCVIDLFAFMVTGSVTFFLFGMLAGLTAYWLGGLEEGQGGPRE